MDLFLKTRVTLAAKLHVALRSLPDPSPGEDSLERCLELATTLVEEVKARMPDLNAPGDLDELSPPQQAFLAAACVLFEDAARQHASSSYRWKVQASDVVDAVSSAQALIGLALRSPAPTAPAVDFESEQRRLEESLAGRSHRRGRSP